MNKNSKDNIYYNHIIFGNGLFLELANNEDCSISTNKIIEKYRNISANTNIRNNFHKTPFNVYWNLLKNNQKIMKKLICLDDMHNSLAYPLFYQAMLLFFFQKKLPQDNLSRDRLYYEKIFLEIEEMPEEEFECFIKDLVDLDWKTNFKNIELFNFIEDIFIENDYIVIEPNKTHIEELLLEGIKYKNPDELKYKIQLKNITKNKFLCFLNLSISWVINVLICSKIILNKDQSDKFKIFLSNIDKNFSTKNNINFLKIATTNYSFPFNDLSINKSYWPIKEQILFLHGEIINEENIPFFKNSNSILSNYKYFIEEAKFEKLTKKVFKKHNLFVYGLSPLGEERLIERIIDNNNWDKIIVFYKTNTNDLDDWKKEINKLKQISREKFEFYESDDAWIENKNFWSTL